MAKKSSTPELDDIFGSAVDNQAATKKTVAPTGEAARLEKAIVALDTAYEAGEDCINPLTGQIVLDNEYDAMKKRLFDIRPTSFIFKSVTASKVSSSGKKIQHNPPMTSINKCNGTETEKQEILAKWFKDCGVDLDGEIPTTTNQVVMSYKHDGIALSVEYVNGQLVKAGLRSKSGVDGEDVTDKTLYIKGLPQSLPVSINCVVRGEIECFKSIFEKKNAELIENGEEPKANPRAYVAGCMGRKTAAEIMNAGLSFMGYNILNYDKAPYKTELERAKFAKETLKINYINLFPFAAGKIRKMEDEHRNADFLIDGIVLSVNNLEEQEQLGKTGSGDTANPKGKLAYKFADQEMTAIVKDIIWQVGRTGNVTPVLTFNGIPLEGTIVSRCTAHNLGIILNNKIGKDSKISIIKSGKIIPKIKSVIEAKGKVEYPSKCPSCNGPTTKVDNDDACALVCKNANCPAQNVRNMFHYLTTIGCKGIGESMLEKLSEAGKLKRYADLYKLTIPTLKDMEVTERMALLTAARILMITNPEEIKDNDELMKKINSVSMQPVKLPMAVFFSALGVSGAGKEIGRILSAEYGNFDKIRNLTVDELTAIDGIGPITAKSIVDYFKNNKEDMDALLDCVELELPKQGTLSGKNFCFTGGFPDGKEYWMSLVEEQGGKCQSSVSKKTHFCVVGDAPGSKKHKAEELNIPRIDLEGLKKMLGL